MQRSISILLLFILVQGITFGQNATTSVLKSEALVVKNYTFKADRKTHIPVDHKKFDILLEVRLCADAS